ncbi:MAG: glutathione S-transferase N-terminal domain-containing protein [Gammaproteobacteria bacterium]|nr:glutathione S-transferase N-terminal domain-containing protein [Gammaproteobacteria bacterium]
MPIRLARKAIGALIIGIDKLTSPSGPARSIEQQTIIDQKTSGLKIYEMLACPFCVKVRREVKRLGLNIARVDVKKQADEMTTLVNQGGKFQVPCLRIEQGQQLMWLYESDEIIKYLREICSANN